MAKTPIATIRLAPGRVGFYDEYSRIHLTLTSPTAVVYSGTNCAQLRRSVKAHVIDVISGSLGEEIPPFKIVNVNGTYKLAINKPVISPAEKKEAVEDKTPSVPKKEALEEPEKLSEAVAEEEPAKTEQAPEDDTVAEEPAKKKTAKKSTAKKTAAKKKAE